MMDPERRTRRSAGGPPRRTAGPGALKSPASYAGLGIQLAASILLGLYAGQWLDTRLGTAPLMLILGVFLGAGAGFYNLYRVLTATQRHERDRTDE